MKSNSPDGFDVLVYATKTLRNSKGEKVEYDSQVRGDDWFGDVEHNFELRKCVEINSTFVVNNSTNFFLMVIFHRTLQARCVYFPARHWIEMPTKISGISLFGMDRTQNQQGVSYFVPV